MQHAAADILEVCGASCHELVAQAEKAIGLSGICDAPGKGCARAASDQSRGLVEHFGIFEKLLVRAKNGCTTVVSLRGHARSQRFELEVSGRNRCVELTALVIRIGGSLLDDRILMAELEHDTDYGAGRCRHSAKPFPSRTFGASECKRLALLRNAVGIRTELMKKHVLDCGDSFGCVFTACDDCQCVTTTNFQRHY